MPTKASVLPLPKLVDEQAHLTGYIPTVMGPVEFREWKQQLERIDEILGLGGVEEVFQRLSLARRNEDERAAAEKEKRAYRDLSNVEQASYQRLSSQALRCNVARTLTGESFRDFGCRLSESMLLQQFCKLDRIDTVRVPGKSALQRYSQWLAEGEMRKVIDSLVGAASGRSEGGVQTLELTETLNLDAYFLDTTCVKLNIHFPVDWVLLRDAARTLMKATMLIRQRGLKERMEEPGEFLKQMNRLCMEMTHARRRKDSKRARKAVLRKMKKLSKIIAAHAARHREVLEQRWEETDFKAGEARQIMARIDMILESLRRLSTKRTSGSSAADKCRIKRRF